MLSNWLRKQTPYTQYITICYAILAGTVVWANISLFTLLNCFQFATNIKSSYDAAIVGIMAFASATLFKAASQLLEATEKVD